MWENFDISKLIFKINFFLMTHEYEQVVALKENPRQRCIPTEPGSSAVDLIASINRQTINKNCRK